MATNSRPSTALSHALRRRPVTPPRPSAKRTGATQYPSHQRNSRPGTASPTGHAAPAPVKGHGKQGTKKPAPAQASTSPHDAQIQSEAALRFGPQTDALATLLRQAVADRDQGIEVQRSTGTGLVDLATRAAPKVAGLEAAGAARLAAPYAGLQQDFAGLSATADPIKAATARDFALASANQTADATAAGVELEQRKVDALSGRQAGIVAVQAQYATDRGKIGDQLSSLMGQQGAFGASRLAELLGVDEKRRQDVADTRQQQTFQAGQNQAGRDVTTRGQDISHSDRVAAAKAKNAGRLPGGAKLRPDKDHGMVQDQVGALAQEIKANAADYTKDDQGRPQSRKAARAEMARDFSTGVAPTEIDDGKGGKLKDPGIPKAPSDLALSVALDLVYDGHVSKRNVDRLHKRGFSVKNLGLPTKRPKPPSSRQVQQAGSAVAGTVGRVV